MLRKNKTKTYLIICMYIEIDASSSHSFFFFQSFLWRNDTDLISFISTLRNKFCLPVIIVNSIEHM